MGNLSLLVSRSGSGGQIHALHEADEPWVSSKGVPLRVSTEKHHVDVLFGVGPLEPLQSFG